MTIAHAWFGKDTPTESERSEQHDFFQSILRKEKSGHTLKPKTEHVVYKAIEPVKAVKQVFNMEKYKQACLVSEKRNCTDHKLKKYET